jgi:hypothetical protein
MITREDIHMALEKYVQSSRTKDSRPAKIRLSELEPSSIDFLETRIRYENSKEINRLEIIIVNLAERMKKLEDCAVFEDKVGAIVLRKTALFLGLLAAIAALVTLFIKIMDF